MRFQKFNDFSDFLRRRQQLPKPSSSEVFQIALMGWSNLQILADVLQAQGRLNDTNVDVHMAEFNSFESEILQTDSSFQKFTADLTVIFFQPLASLIQTSSSGSPFDIQAEVSKRRLILERARKISRIVFFFDEAGGPDFLCWNSHPDFKQARQHLNNEMHRQQDEACFTLPLSEMTEQLGLPECFDFRSWYETKMYFSSDACVEIAARIFQQFQNLHRPLTKVLALDLDQTLWGGILSEDGISGVRIGGHDPIGEFYFDFQQQLRFFKQCGILLALVTKNDESQVHRAFEKLPTPLKIEDFVGIWANWEPKYKSLQEISDKLGLSLDQILFMDDDAFEIAEAQSHLPSLQTLHLSANLERRPAQVREALRWDWHQQTTVADLNRTQSYRSLLEQRRLSQTWTDHDQFLESLQIQIQFQDFQEQDLGRIHQLFQKTNQFNQRTERRTRSELEEIAKGPHPLTGFSYSVQDRFSDLGLVGALLVRRQDDALWIEDWVMSCRSLNRRIESRVLKLLQERYPQVRTVHLQARPTERNQLFFKSLQDLRFLENPESGHELRSFTLNQENQKNQEPHHAST
jgi:FkbH-like protein